MKSKLIIILSFLGLAALIFSCSTNESSPPNILFAIADDWSWAHNSHLEFPEVNTPAFDRVATQGVYFENAYCNAPSCCPSRATILTGKNGWELEEGGTHWSFLPKKYKVYTDLLQENDYFIGLTGKGWGPGNLEASGRKINPAGKAFIKYKTEPPASGMNRTDYAENFKDFLSVKPEGKPFCFWYGGYEPHRQYEYSSGKGSGKDLSKAIVPGFLPDNEVTRNDVADYLLEIEWFDTHLGRMIELLEEKGELENTLIVVTGDHGMPFPRAKASLYDYGTHTPLAIMWGNKIKGGRSISDFISFIDFAPTFLDVAGVEIPDEMTGKSLKNILLSKKDGRIEPQRNRVFTYRERHGWVRENGEIAPVRSIRKDNFLLIWNIKPHLLPTGSADPTLNWCNCPFGDSDPGPSKSNILELASQGDSTFFQLAFGLRPEFELYDVVNDPYQLNNLSQKADFKKTLEELTAELKSYLKETGDPRMEGRGDIFENAPYFGGKGPAQK